MKAELQEALANYLTAIGDDELILAHRDSQWAGHAPILEEDIGFANLALDELGHASIWYRLAAELRNVDPDRHPDTLVFARPASEFRNVRMVELPNGDWAFSMLRQYLFDASEQVRLNALAASQYPGLAEAAAKIRTEELYHLRHTRAWVRRLGLGTQQSNRKMQTALDLLYPHALQLFVEGAGELALAQAGLVPRPDRLLASWASQVSEEFIASELRLPDGNLSTPAGRTAHTSHLEPLVAELQQVARLETGVAW
ncbi:MAG TPA: 1,2-phenylacetyl-CoA epoxidase subunit PaaC [Anaerolineales bacterium]|nr:1,2-phenylacetyl-CoA epoxidase subunit PaaC [Anaerolineales bacterium]